MTRTRGNLNGRQLNVLVSANNIPQVDKKIKNFRWHLGGKYKRKGSLHIMIDIDKCL